MKRAQRITKISHGSLLYGAPTPNNSHLEEYQDWIEYCLNVIDKAREKIIKDNGVDVKSFEYGVAVGLGRAIEVILGVEEE